MSRPHVQTKTCNETEYKSLQLADIYLFTSKMAIEAWCWPNKDHRIKTRYFETCINYRMRDIFQFKKKQLKNYWYAQTKQMKLYTFLELVSMYQIENI